MQLSKRLAAELFGTFWLVFGGCGAALISAAFPSVGIGFVGVAFAFGLTVLTMAYAVGPISGGHFNPAVSFGLAVAGRLEWAHLIGYWIAQLIGGIVGAGVLYLIASGKTGFVAGGFASNGYDALSPGGYSMVAAFIAEVVRAGILSVHKGQMEAGSSLGLHRGAVLRLIVIPQALRVILPPLTNQYLNLTKNSSLAVGIGYPDLVSVFAGTTLSQTGQAIEIIGITMGVYLLISLVTSAIMSFYGWRIGRSMGG